MPIIAWIGNLLFTWALGSLNLFAKQTVINVAIAAAATAAFGVALSLLIQELTDAVQPLIAQASNIPALPYFLPSNIPECIAAYVSVSIAGTLYAMTTRWIENRAAIFKA